MTTLLQGCDNFTIKLCASLYFCNGSPLPHITIYLSRYGIDPSSTVISDVTCSSSDYQVILQCSYNTTIAASCTNDDGIAVTCCECTTRKGLGRRGEREEKGEGEEKMSVHVRE